MPPSAVLPMTKEAAFASVQLSGPGSAQRGGGAHVGDVDGGDVLRLLGEQGEGDGVAGGGEPDRLVDAFEQDLALRALVLGQHHAAVAADRGVGEGVGGGLLGLLLAGGEGEERRGDRRTGTCAHVRTRAHTTCISLDKSDPANLVDS